MNRDVHTGTWPRAGFLLSRFPKATARGRPHGVDSGQIVPIAAGLAANCYPP